MLLVLLFNTTKIFFLLSLRTTGNSFGLSTGPADRKKTTNITKTSPQARATRARGSAHRARATNTCASFPSSPLVTQHRARSDRRAHCDCTSTTRGAARSQGASHMGAAIARIQWNHNMFGGNGGFVQVAATCQQKFAGTKKTPTGCAAIQSGCRKNWAQL